jgi:hypothetical protein
MPVTRLNWLAAVAGALVVSCGEGRAIFNIDVLSYRPTLADTLPYSVPGGTSGSGQDAFRLQLPGGLGNSTVDSVSLRYGSTVLNTAGSGRFILEIFFSSDSSTVFTSSVRFVDTALVAAADTQLLGPITVPLFADSLFSKEALFVGVRGSVLADPGPTMTGRLVTVSLLRLRIVLQDKIF